jgi:ribose transport system substrate-binding protein
MKKSIVLLVVMLLAAWAIIACGGAPEVEEAAPAPEQAAPAQEESASEEPAQEEAQSGEPAGPRTFGASYFTLNNPHFLDWRDGLNEVFEPNGDTLINADAQLDINKQISDVEDMIQQGVDAIFIAPADSKAIKTALLSAQNADIPVFIMDVPVEDDELVVSTIATNNFMAGQVLGEALVEDFNGEAKVALLDWPVVKAVTDRTDGFFSVVDEYPGIEVVARQDGGASVEGSLPVMENFLQSNPEIQAVFCINDPSCMGAMSAIEAAGRTDIKLYSIDGSADGIRLTCEGRFQGTSAQFPVTMGNIAAQTAYDYLAGEEVEHDIAVDSLWIGQDNCGEFMDAETQGEVQEQPEAAAPSGDFTPADAEFAGVCGPYTDPVPLAEGAQASLDTISYDGGDITIAYLPMGTEFNFHIALNEGIEDITKASDNDGLDSFMLSPYSGSDQAGQMGMLQDVSSRPDVDAIVLISFDEQALAPLVEEAVNNGKAVIIINSDILEYPTPIHGVIGVNQRAANHALYDWAREQLGDDPRTVAVLEGEPGYLNDERSGGFKDGVEGTNWEIVSSVNGGWSVEKGNTTAMDVLQAHPDLEVLFAANDYMAQGAALAAQELGREDLFILGYDGDVNALEDIYRGLIDATTNASPVIMGRQAACFALDILNGKTTGGYVNTPTTIVYQENVAEVLSKPEDLFPVPSAEILSELGVSVAQ